MLKLLTLRMCLKLIFTENRMKYQSNINRSTGCDIHDCFELMNKPILSNLAVIITLKTGRNTVIMV